MSTSEAEDETGLKSIATVFKDPLNDFRLRMSDLASWEPVNLQHLKSDKKAKHILLASCLYSGLRAVYQREQFL